jgi:hypothetical protein
MDTSEGLGKVVDATEAARLTPESRMFSTVVRDKKPLDFV